MKEWYARILKFLKYRTQPVRRYLVFKSLAAIGLLTPGRPRRKPLVSIFGSCRQDSVFNYFKVTDIRNGLTYPHYTKEIIQSIRYCKGELPEIPDWAFRNKQINLPIRSQQKLYRDFKRTDIFVIEVASMLEYEFEGVYLHHELYDNAAAYSNSTFPKKHEIKVREQTIEELREDLKTIVSLLGVKKILFASHISTRTFGKRASLVNELVEFCSANGIAIFNPADLMQHYDEEELFVKEPILSHLTDFGHRIAGYRYREIIEVLSISLSSNRLPLIQTLEAPERVPSGYTSGFGDFLIGSLKVFEISRKLGRIPLIDFSNSYFADHLVNNCNFSRKKPVLEIFHEDSDLKFISATNVFTNKPPRSPVGEEHKDFLYRNCLNQKLALRRQVQDVIDRLGIKAGTYESVHIRVDDGFDEFPDASVIGQLEIAVFAKINASHKETILISSSNIIREHFRSLGLKCPEVKVTHSADPNATSKSIENTLIEFFLLGNSSKIYQFSSYGWGSGFSTLAATIYGITIERVAIPEYES